MAETKPERSATDQHGADRRKTIKGLMVASIAAPMVLTPRKSRAATIKLTVRDPGGPYVKAMNEAFYKPFNDAMKGDIVVTGVISAHEPTAMIKSMVESKTYTWDIAGGFSISSTMALLEGPGYLEKLNIDDDPEVQEIPTRFRMPYMLGYEVFTCVMAYRTDVFPKKAPAPVNGWKDLWDVARIPGIRSLRKNPFYTIEQAVMADGVPGNQVYAHLRKNGFDPAFKSLDKIKKNVNIWWTGAAQTSQLLATGEVDMVPTFNGRAQDAIDGGAPVALSWNQALLDLRRHGDHQGRPARRGVPQVREVLRQRRTPGHARQAHRRWPDQPEGVQAHPACKSGRARHRSGQLRQVDRVRCRLLGQGKGPRDGSVQSVDLGMTLRTRGP